MRHEGSCAFDVLISTREVFSYSSHQNNNLPLVFVVFQIFEGVI